MLCNENIFADIQAENPEKAFEVILSALKAPGLDLIQRKTILRLLTFREQYGTTALGQGIALPHCFSPDISSPIVAFARSRKGIDFPSLDGRPVHFIFLLILPQCADAEQTKRDLLQRIKWFLSDRYLQERLKTADTVDEIKTLLVPEVDSFEIVSEHMEA